MRVVLLVIVLALDAVDDVLAEIFDDADVFQPCLVCLILTSLGTSFRLCRRRTDGRSSRLRFGRAGEFTVEVWSRAGVGALEHATRVSAAGIRIEVGPQCGCRGLARVAGGDGGKSWV